ATVASALEIMASMGVTDLADLRPHMLRRRIDPRTERSCEELYEWLEPGQLLAEPPEAWAADWKTADLDRFAV
ncbi:FMN-binding glutamate synthase family protein, partial [Streptomyces sp. SID625]|nr:FMN-binding glutamate synthase family protein [Streptomyces sp. SID625]